MKQFKDLYNSLWANIHKKRQRIKRGWDWFSWSPSMWRCDEASDKGKRFWNY